MAEYGSGFDGKEGQLIKPGEFVEELDEWCFASDREAGDIAIIENVYGYTICYISVIYN